MLKTIVEIKRRRMYRVALILWICVCCSCQSQDERRLEYALEQAGENRAELEKVLDHYAGDSLKLEAARFLIRNMPYHIGLYDTLFDVRGKKYMPDISFPTYSDEEVERTFDSLLSCGYQVRQTKKRDIEFAKADFLIDNIDCAFEAWKKPWAKAFSFDDFCRYILPYRLSNEPLCALRGEMQKKHFPMLDSLRNNDPVEVCLFLNKELTKSFRFVSEMPLQISIETIEQYGRSNCEGIAIYFGFLMRSVGIPVVLDCTTWSKFSDGHYWASVMDVNRTWHGFAPSSLNADDFKKLFSTKRRLIPPKVYRRMFVPESADMGVDDDGYRTYVKNPLFKDVTATYYTPPVDVVMELPESVEERTAYVYLCASAVNHFQVLAVGTRTGRKCVVKNVVGDNTFILADSPDGKSLRFLTDTFYVDSIGQIFNEELWIGKIGSRE